MLDLLVGLMVLFLDLCAGAVVVAAMAPVAILLWLLGALGPSGNDHIDTWWHG